MPEKEVGFVRMGKVAEKVKEIKEIGVSVLGYAFMGKAHTNAYIKMLCFVDSYANSPSQTTKQPTTLYHLSYLHPQRRVFRQRHTPIRGQNRTMETPPQASHPN